MNFNIFKVIAGMEAVLIILLILSRYNGAHLIIKSVPVVVSPLELALEYQAPDKKFEDLVKTNPSWIKYKIILPDGTKGMSILASCAILQLTNHVQILLENGADKEEAVDSLKKVGAIDAVSLIQHIDSDLKARNGYASKGSGSFIANDIFPNH